MATNTLTVANSSVLLSIASLFPIPTKLEGYATDDAFSANPITQAEVQIGVDGILSAGFVFNPAELTIVFQATSPSLQIMEAWRSTQAAGQEVFSANMIINLPAIGMTYVLSNGYLTSAKPMPDAKKLLQPMPYVITFESIIGAPTR